MKKYGFYAFLLMVFACSFCPPHLYAFYKTKQTPLISVLMSTYNRDNGLPTAIESILGQTYPHFEFIIIDDGSDDETAKVVREYAAKDPRIVFVQNEKNMGLIYSLNRGLKMAKGKYIARMDDDDQSLPHRFERQVNVMEKHPELAVLGGRTSGKNSNVKIKMDIEPVLTDPKYVEIQSYFSSALAHPTIMIRRDFLVQNNIEYPTEFLYAEDCGLYRLILEKGGKLSAVQEPVLRFRVTKSKPGRAGYGGVQSDSFKRLQQEKLRPLIGELEPNLKGAFISRTNKCIIMKRMFEANAQKQIVDQETLGKIIQEECPEKDGKRWHTSHPYWKDIIIFEPDMHVSREKANDSGTIKKGNADEVIINWEKYPAEVYRMNEEEQTLTYIRDVDGKIKKR